MSACEEAGAGNGLPREETEMNKRSTGAVYERKAGEYLRRQGYTILQYNDRCRAGEIDIVARDGEIIVFCEVKYRGTVCRGGALEAVTPGKQRTLSRCALFYLAEHRLTDAPCRFDVAGIEGEAGRVIHVKDAFAYRE